jgi:DNA (cytosine-5)-methyltransferase 1
MTHGSLFSGRGGFDTGAEWAGVETLWNCETNVFLKNKLKQLFPNAKQYGDIRTMGRHKEGGGKSRPYGSVAHVDIVTGGFPCQDISSANTTDKKGIGGARSGLWREMARVVGEVKPRYIIIENSPELLKRGWEYVLSDLYALGYNAEWDCYRAADFGYPHNRLRLYCIAYTGGDRRGRKVLRPPGAFALHAQWTPTPAYLRVSTGWANGFRDIRVIQRDDEFLNFECEIAAFGNAVMPVVAEHLVRCAVEDNNLEIKKLNNLGI